MRSCYHFFLFCLIWLSPFFVLAQDKDIKVANEYFLTAEYQKAYEKFGELGKKPQNIPLIYTNYLATLKTLKKQEEAEKFVKKSIKAFPDNFYYKLDLYTILKEKQDTKANKYFEGIVDDIKNNPIQVEGAAEYLLKANDTEKTRDLLLAARKASSNKSDYAIALSKVYRAMGQKDLMIEEMLNYVNSNPFQIENTKNTFQNQLSDKEDFQLLETKLYDLVQKNPENLIYNELLLWINIQNKNFRNAYFQAKAIDKKSKLQGTKLIEVGRIAMENKDFESAQKYFQAVADEYKGTYNYSHARRLLIYSKEESVKNTYPVNKDRIYSLISDYKSLITELGTLPQSYEAMRSMALLYGFYLDRKDTAIVLLQQVINQVRGDEKLRAQAKINLADIYLLNEEPWEASLLYSQVEKDMKEDQIGHEAKLKNAKVAYYKGEFELAQEHLDILKMATTREIANDAMDLSILIQDNIGLDSNYEALNEYAAIDLLLFQNKEEEALERLNAMLVKFPNHSLTDEILWLKTKIYRKRGMYQEALANIDLILSRYSDGIFADDAMYTKGIIEQENLKNTDKAMETYKDFLFKYPGSIYSAEVRKRFRLLRGDKL